MQYNALMFPNPGQWARKLPRRCVWVVPLWSHHVFLCFLSPNSITPTFTETFLQGKSRMHIMNVADTKGDKSWSHDVSVKVHDTNHESRGHKPSQHVKMFVTKCVTSLRQTYLGRCNGI